MKRNIIISLLVAAIGVIALSGCEKPEPIEVPIVMEPQITDTTITNETPQSQDTTTNQASFLIGEWAVNPYLSHGISPNYTDTLLFTAEGIVEKHSILAGRRYVLINDTTLRIYDGENAYDKVFTYYPTEGIMFYNFWDNTILSVIKDVYYERVKYE